MQVSVTVKASDGSTKVLPLQATVNAAGGAAPTWDHIVIAVMENHAQQQIIGNSGAPYLTALANGNANFTQSFGVAHPSQPNYLALFSGSVQGVTDDNHHGPFTTTNIATQLTGAGKTFTGYSEDLPSVGYTGDSSGGYARKHNPWVQFSAIPAASNQPFTAFPTDYTKLPTVSWVIPNLTDDMHDGTVSQGDTWLQTHMDPYLQWAKTHNSLLIVTFDEDDYNSGNHIATVMAGANVKPGTYAETITHYSVLGLVQDAYGLPRNDGSVGVAPITDAFTTAPAQDPGYVAGWGNPTWREEFSGTVVDPATWNVKTGGAKLNQDNAGLYAGNVSIVKDTEGSYLRIQGRKEANSSGRPYTSGYMDTIGKFAVPGGAGRWEMRARIPTALNQSRGSWPAFWLRTDGGSGEIDIMEAYGTPLLHPEWLKGTGGYAVTLHQDTMHSAGTVQIAIPVPAPASGPLYQGWHTFALEWVGDTMKFLLDGVVVCTDTSKAGVSNYQNAPVPWWGTFGGNWHVRLNLQIGGGQGDPADAVAGSNPAWPYNYDVDYVRYWGPLT